MALFRRSTAEVVRRGVGGESTEELKTRKVGRSTVKVRRVRQLPAPPANGKGKKPRSAAPARRRKTAARPRSRAAGPKAPSRRRTEGAAAQRPETGRKQMLVRVLPHQTQVVVLEGSLLVEHYVHRSDQESLVGNIYMGKVKSVLPGLEAAFLDIGAEKNGVIYAGDLNSTRRTRGRGPSIEQSLKHGQQLLVQVDKDPMGGKGPRLTSQITLPGRHLVLSPLNGMLGISRRLPEEERIRLRKIIQSAQPKGHGVIVRTAAAGASREEISADIERLVKKWKEIEKSNGDGPVPRVIHQEPSLLLRVIREHFNHSSAAC